MSRHPFSVRFNRSVVSGVNPPLTQEELRSLSTTLCDDPFCNEAYEGVDNLYCLEWERDHGGIKSALAFLYVADVNIRHIEVIAVTTKKGTDRIEYGGSSNDLSRIEDSERIGNLVKFLIRLMYVFYRLWSTASSTDGDGTDHFDYGP